MLPLSQGIKQHGLMDVTLNDAQISTINKINIDLNGPLLEIKNAASLPINATVDIRMIDINDFFKTLPYEGIYAEGHIGGKLELEITENAITVQSGALNSLGEGRIHINPRWTNLLLGSDNHDASQTANALKNFEFNSINITMTGNLLATPHITIELNGHTPSMFDGKDFSMTLDFEKPIEQFFAPILMNGPE